MIPCYKKDVDKIDKQKKKQYNYCQPLNFIFKFLWV